MSFLTRPGNESLLKMELAKIELIKIITGNQDPEMIPREELPLFETPGGEPSIPVRNDQLPNAGTHIPKYAMYNGHRVNVIAPAEGGRFEILVDESRTTVNRDRLIFIK